MKRWIKILIGLGVALVVSVLVGVYANSFYQDKTEFVKDYYESRIEETTESQLATFMEYTEQYYTKEPIYTQAVTNASGTKLFDLFIYGAKIVTTVESTETTTQRFIIVAYNVDYVAMKNCFSYSSTSAAEKGTIPNINIILTPIEVEVDEDSEEEVETGTEITITLGKTGSDSVMGVVDYGVNQNSSDELDEPDPFTVGTYSAIYYHKYDTAETDLTYSNGYTSKIVLNNTRDSGLDDNKRTVNLSEFNFLFNNDVDSLEYVEGHNTNQLSAGYTGWVIGKYLWWECLIAFVGVGGLATLFIIIWEYDAGNNKNNSKIQPKNRRK